LLIVGNIITAGLCTPYTEITSSNPAWNVVVFLAFICDVLWNLKFCNGLSYRRPS